MWGKTTDLVGEIAAASQEQAQGIEQVNTAMSQMDKVTQQNAANAEESASASEELNAQASSMQQIVGELVSLVGGSAGQQRSHTTVSTRSPRRQKTLTRSDQVFHKIAQSKTSSSNSASPAPQAVIPLSDEEMDAFNR